MHLKTDSLKVPGADLFYEVRGTGPLLLLIHGGNGNAAVFYGIKHKLAESYTVVTYDRRGHTRSKLADLNEPYRIETHSNDAHRLLAALTDEPAYVFGSSSGAVIGLDLAARHPEQVRMLIPHEPPLLQFLSDEERSHARNVLEKMEQDSRTAGLFPAFQKFASTVMGFDLGQEGHQLNEAQRKQFSENLKYFIEQEAPRMKTFRIHVDALKEVLQLHRMQIKPAGGNASRAFFPYRCALGLADQIGVRLEEFPGNHVGYAAAPHLFAERLQEMLQSEKDAICDGENLNRR